MSKLHVTSMHLEAIYDAIITMKFIGQVLSEGEISDDQASDMSWLLGSMRKKLEPVNDLLEEFEYHQTHGDAPAAPQDDLLKLGSDILALTEKLSRRRRELNGGEA